MHAKYRLSMTCIHRPRRAGYEVITYDWAIALRNTCTTICLRQRLQIEHVVDSTCMLYHESRFMVGSINDTDTPVYGSSSKATPDSTHCSASSALPMGICTSASALARSLQRYRGVLRCARCGNGMSLGSHARCMGGMQADVGATCCMAATGASKCQHLQ